MTLMSFSFRKGIPEGYVIYDCRSMPNPHHNPLLQPLTGKDKAVRDFVISSEAAKHMVMDAMRDVRRGHKVAFGCVGGRHRSVSMAILTQEWLALTKTTVDVIHRELD